MTNEQEEHLGEVKEFITERIDQKYRAGQKEHGGNLWAKPTLPMLLDEVTDQVVYAQTLRAQIAEAVSTLQNAIASQDWNEAAKVLAMLTGQLRPPVD